MGVESVTVVKLAIVRMYVKGVGCIFVDRVLVILPLTPVHAMFYLGYSYSLKVASSTS
jgi:hypothetical protein